MLVAVLHLYVSKEKEKRCRKLVSAITIQWFFALILKLNFTEAMNSELLPIGIAWKQDKKTRWTIVQTFKISRRLSNIIIQHKNLNMHGKHLTNITTSVQTEIAKIFMRHQLLFNTTNTCLSSSFSCTTRIISLINHNHFFNS